MSLKQSMNILLEDMKKLDAKIEADMKDYAMLLSAIEKHEMNFKQYECDKKKLEKMFYTISGKRDYEDDSVHVKVLEDNMQQARQNSEEIRLKIEERKAYYKALADNNISDLWDVWDSEGDETSILAAIYFSYEKENSVLTAFDNCYGRIFNMLDCNSEIICYLLEKTLIKSDLNLENNQNQKNLDEKMYLLFRTIEPSLNSMVWNHIEASLRIRETQRIISYCEVTMEEFRIWIKHYEEDVTSYKRTISTISEEIKKLNNDKLGAEVEACIHRTKEWFSNNSKALSDTVLKCDEQAEIIQVGIQYLERCKVNLVFEEAAGIEHQTAVGLMEAIEKRREQKEQFAGLRCLETELQNMLAEYHRQLKEIQRVKDQIIEYKKQKEREKIEKREAAKRKRLNRRRKKGTETYITGAFLIFVLAGGVFGWQDSDWEVKGILGYLPAPVTLEELDVEDTYSPYFISFGKMSILSIYSGADLKIIWIPFAEDLSVYYYNVDGEEIYIPKNASSVLIDSCNNLVALEIPKSVNEITISNCEQLEHIDMPLDDVSRKVVVENCPMYEQ